MTNIDNTTIKSEQLDSILHTDLTTNDDNLLDTEFLNEVNIDFDSELINTTTNDPCCSNDTNNILLNKLYLNYKKAEHKIEKNFNYLINYLNLRKTHLINKLNKIYEKKCSNIKLDKIENEFIAFTAENDETPTMDANEGNHNSSSLLKQILKLIANYGQIISTDAIEENCTLSGEGLMQCFMNEEATFTLSCRDINGNLTKTHSSFINAYIVLHSSASSSPTTSSPNIVAKCKLDFLANGLYLVKYKLEKEGNYLLYILLNNKHILNSPYKITCLNNRFIKLSKQNNLPISCLSLINNNNAPAATSNLNSQRKVTIKSPTTKDIVKSTSFSQMNNNSGVFTINIGNNNSNGMPRAMSSYAASSNLSPRITSTNANARRISMLPMPTKHTSSSKHVDNSLDSSLNSANTTSSELKAFLDSNLKDDLKLSIGSKGRGPAEFLNPQSICITNEFLYATDSNNQRVHVFALNGEFKFSFGDHSSSHSIPPSTTPPSARSSSSTSHSQKSNETQNTAGILRRPIGITKLDDENKILIVDYESKCVNIYDLNGQYINKIGHTKLLGPKGVCINKALNNEIIVADCKANAICIFNLNGKLIKRFGSQGSKNENFAAPHYVSCLSNGHIVISDFYNHCVKVFNSNGSFQYSFGTHGGNHGQFNGPTGVCVDQYDNIVVADWGNSRIQVFDKHGKFLKFVNTELNQLYGPQDLKVIDNTNLVAISDSGNHCIKIFNYL